MCGSKTMTKDEIIEGLHKEIDEAHLDAAASAQEGGLYRAPDTEKLEAILELIKEQEAEIERLTILELDKWVSELPEDKNDIAPPNTPKKYRHLIREQEANLRKAKEWADIHRNASKKLKAHRDEAREQLTTANEQLETAHRLLERVNNQYQNGAFRDYREADLAIDIKEALAQIGETNDKE